MFIISLLCLNRNSFAFSVQENVSKYVMVITHSVQRVHILYVENLAHAYELILHIYLHREISSFLTSSVLYFSDYKINI